MHDEPDSRVVFALDLPDEGAARAMAFRVRDAVGMLKVGLELFVNAGPRAVAGVLEAKRPVFLDLKLHDIPETVDRAVGRVAQLGVRVVTVHASGGRAMLRRAVERAAKEKTGLGVVAVTVLTSLEGDDLASMGVDAGVTAHGVRLGRLAFEEGVRSFVCSPHEAAALRQALGREAVIFTPGVRGAGDLAGDQKRVMTAAEAVAAGADWVVVGRPIRDAVDPLAAAQAFAREARCA
jgi:orotidine-5'-phosphate decarboxylase